VIRASNATVIAIIGLIVVTVSVLGGFSWAGGKLGALFQPPEYVTIVGVALGSMLAATPRTVLVVMARKIKGVFGSGAGFTPAFYLDALKLQYEIYQLARRDGLVALESHIENPKESAVFGKYPAVLAHGHAIHFFCDSLRLVLLGSVPPHDLEALMDGEIEVHHEEAEKPVEALTKVSDSLPGIGIVAAVLGIVVTMQSIGGDTAVIGEKVAAALVGTFLGILLSYGFLAPIASNIQSMNAGETRFYVFLKAGVVAFAKGLAPLVAVEFARRAIFADSRPTFEAMETACKETRKDKAA
jgi:chemotaxis protein MotA